MVERHRLFAWPLHTAYRRLRTDHSVGKTHASCIPLDTRFDNNSHTSIHRLLRSLCKAQESLDSPRATDSLRTTSSRRDGYGCTIFDTWTYLGLPSTLVAEPLRGARGRTALVRGRFTASSIFLPYEKFDGLESAWQWPNRRFGILRTCWDAGTTIRAAWRRHRH